MRTLKTSLFLCTTLVSVVGYAQDDYDSEGTEPATDEAPEVEAQVSTTAAVATPAPQPQAAVAAAPAPTGSAPLEEQLSPSAPRTRGGPETGSAWQMNYYGYFRAPMRVGLGTRTVTDPTTGAVTPGGLSVHTPVIPDDQYASWGFTKANNRDWAEMFFSVGNGTVSGTLAIQAFQFTDPSWKQDNAQFGIGQGWVEVNSDLGFENIKFNAKAGSFWARYGMAGRYDAGEFDTYLIGRTHTMGGLARVDFDLGMSTLAFEGGFGAHQPNPEMFNRARFTPMVHGHMFWENEQMELGLHAMYAWADQGTVPIYPNVQPGSNCGSAGSSNPLEAPGIQCTPNPNILGAYPNGTPGVFGPLYPNGSQLIVGVDARIDLGLAGYLYAGYSHMFLKNSLTISQAIEAVHTFGGGEYKLGATDAYLESPFCPSTSLNVHNPVPNESCSNGNGSVGSILAQYEVGLSNFGVFSGDMDLQFRLYGMANFVSVGDDEVTWLTPVAQRAGVSVDEIRQNGTMKLKFGLDSEFYLTDFMSIAARLDRLQPHSKISEQTFMVLSPRITFRSQMVTHETISIQYSRYIYNSRICRDDAGLIVSPADSPFRSGSVSGQDYTGAAVRFRNGLQADAFCAQPAPSGSVPQGFGATSDNQPVGTRGAPTLFPDENVIKVEASMWW